MKKYVVFSFFVLLFNYGKAQYTLNFCEDVSKEGKPVMVSNQFMVDGDGGVLKFLVRSDDKFNTSQLDFRIYYITDGGLEEEIERLPQAVQTDWNFAWKEMVVYDPGVYRVKVFTDKGTYLTSANLTVKGK